MNHTINLPILDHMECPLCMEYMMNHIHLCKNGHSLCARCKTSVDKCPICRSVFSGGRNFVLENIAEVLVYPCKNHHFGCGEFLNKAEHVNHTLDCRFQPFTCRIKHKNGRACEWVGAMHQLLEHSLNVHNTMTWMQEENLDRWKPDTDVNIEIQLVQAHGELFYLTRKLDDNKSIMYWALNHIGFNDLWKDFKLYIEVACEKHGRQITITELCQKFETDVNGLFESGNCAGIPSKHLKTFENDFKSVWYNVKIHKLESE